jgi:tRNA(adenine34) deaminase
MGINVDFMQAALTFAAQAEKTNEVPVGAVIVQDGQIIGRGWNCAINQNDPTAHAEIVALREAAKHLSNYRLINCTLYTTLEPCAMCAGAIIHARIQHLVFGAFDPKSGAAGTVCNLFQGNQANHRVKITGGILSQECGAILTNFFRKKRQIS